LVRNQEAALKEKRQANDPKKGRDPQDGSREEKKKAPSSYPAKMKAHSKQKRNMSSRPLNTSGLKMGSLSLFPSGNVRERAGRRHETMMAGTKDRKGKKNVMFCSPGGGGGFKKGKNPPGGKKFLFSLLNFLRDSEAPNKGQKP